MQLATKKFCSPSNHFTLGSAASHLTNLMVQSHVLLLRDWITCEHVPVSIHLKEKVGMLIQCLQHSASSMGALNQQT